LISTDFKQQLLTTRRNLHDGISNSGMGTGPWTNIWGQIFEWIEYKFPTKARIAININ
jgi:hypothetical protein